MKKFSPPEPLSRPELLALCACGFFTLSLQPMLGLAISLWLVQLKMSASVIGLEIGCQAILPLFLSIHVGATMDRIGPRRLMKVVSTVGMLLPLLYPVLPWIVTLSILQLLSGFIYQLVWVGAQTTIGRLAPGNASSYGRFSFSTNCGAFVGPVLVGLAWSHVGPWGGFGSLALWATALFAVCTVLPEAARDNAVESEPKRLLPNGKSYVEAFRLFKIPAVTLVMFSTFLRIATGSMRSSFYPVFLKTVGMSPTGIGILIGCGSLASGFCSLLAAPAVRLLRSQRAALIASLAFSVIALAATPVLPSYGPLLVLTALYGLGMGINQPVLLSVLSSAVGSENQGASAGLRSAINQTAWLTVPTGMGLLIDWVGFADGFYTTGAVLLLILTIASISTAGAITRSAEARDSIPEPADSRR